jgi:hypothetical protein
VSGLELVDASQVVVVFLHPVEVVVGPVEELEVEEEQEAPLPQFPLEEPFSGTQPHSEELVVRPC